MLESGMEEQTFKATYQIGVLFRSDFRNFCFKLNLTIEEDKGLFGSNFRVEGPMTAMHSLQCEVMRVQKQLEQEDRLAKEEESRRKHSRWYRRVGRWFRHQKD